MRFFSRTLSFGLPKPKAIMGSLMTMRVCQGEHPRGWDRLSS